MTPGQESAYIEGQRALCRRVLADALQLCRENGVQVDGAPVVLADLTAALDRLATSLGCTPSPDPRDTVRTLESYLLSVSESQQPLVMDI